MDTSRRLSVLYILAIPIVAGMSTLNFQVAGLNYTGYLWVVLLPVGVYLLVLNRLSGVDPGRILPCWPWVLLCTFIWFSLLWRGSLARHNVQEVLQYTMPLIVGLLAASAVRTHRELRQLFAVFGVALVLLLIYAVAYATERIDHESTGIAVRGAALAAMLVGCVFLARFPEQKFLSIAGFGTCLLVTTLTSSRIATLALLVAPILNPKFKGKLLWKFTAAATFVALGLFIFNTETFQERFFFSGYGTLEDVYAGDFNDQGRFQAWTAIWDEAWHHAWLGAGAAATYDFVPTVWEGMEHIHNDYLKIFYEFGIIGFVLFVAVCVWQFAMIRRQIAARTGGTVRTAFAAAWLGFFAMLISCSTDNTIVYNSLFTNPLFALLGAAFGVDWAERHGLVESDAERVYIPTLAYERPQKKNNRARTAPQFTSPSNPMLKPR